MKIEKEVRGWVGDYLPGAEGKELSDILLFTIDKHNISKDRKALARGIVIGMVVMVLILKWLA